MKLPTEPVTNSLDQSIYEMVSLYMTGKSWEKNVTALRPGRVRGSKKWLMKLLARPL